MIKTNPMLCPVCGVPMNHHANKVTYSAVQEEGAVVDPQMGGVIAEFYTCPQCGRTRSRPVVDESGTSA